MKSGILQSITNGINPSQNWMRGKGVVIGIQKGLGKGTICKSRLGRRTKKEELYRCDEIKRMMIMMRMRMSGDPVLVHY